MGHGKVSKLYKIFQDKNASPAYNEYLAFSKRFVIQRFSEVTDRLGMAILSVTPENPLLWAFLMENFNLGIAKMSVTPENPLFPNPVLPKTSVSTY